MKDELAGDLERFLGVGANQIGFGQALLVPAAADGIDMVFMAIKGDLVFGDLAQAGFLEMVSVGMGQDHGIEALPADAGTFHSTRDFKGAESGINQHIGMRTHDQGGIS